MDQQTPIFADKMKYVFSTCTGTCRPGIARNETLHAGVRLLKNIYVHDRDQEAKLWHESN
jgi:hypothetical protein